MKITKESLFVDLNQGETATKGVPFGFVGTRAADEYRGWFFTHLDGRPIKTLADVREVIATMEIDDGANDLPEIPYHWAEAALRRELRAIMKANRGV